MLKVLQHLTQVDKTYTLVFSGISRNWIPNECLQFSNSRLEEGASAVKLGWRSEAAEVVGAKVDRGLGEAKLDNLKDIKCKRLGISP
jgi:hypothetical protein